MFIQMRSMQNVTGCLFPTAHRWTIATVTKQIIRKRRNILSLLLYTARRCKMYLCCKLFIFIFIGIARTRILFFCICLPYFSLFCFLTLSLLHGLFKKWRETVRDAVIFTFCLFLILSYTCLVF